MARNGRRRWTTEEPPGLPADPDKLDELGINFCLRKLTMAPRTEQELRESLEGRNYPSDSIQRILARMRRAGYVNDELFATLWVESRHRGKGLARRALAGELHRKGIDRELAQEAVETIDADQERARAKALAEGKLRHVTPAVLADPRKLTGRLVSLLARRGYNSGLAYSVVAEVLTEQREQSEALQDVLDELG